MSLGAFEDLVTRPEWLLDQNAAARLVISGFVVVVTLIAIMFFSMGMIGTPVLASPPV